MTQRKSYLDFLAEQQTVLEILVDSPTALEQMVEKATEMDAQACDATLGNASEVGNDEVEAATNVLNNAVGFLNEYKDTFYGLRRYRDAERMANAAHDLCRAAATIRAALLTKKAPTMPPMSEEQARRNAEYWPRVLRGEVPIASPSRRLGENDD